MRPTPFIACDTAKAEPPGLAGSSYTQFPFYAGTRALR